jgi:hypothetical protein
MNADVYPMTGAMVIVMTAIPAVMKQMQWIWRRWWRPNLQERICMAFFNTGRLCELQTAKYKHYS